MQITIEVSDDKSDFVLELLKNLPFVEVKQDTGNVVMPEEADTRAGVNLSPKTAALLGAFPMITTIDETARRQAIQDKHA